MDFKKLIMAGGLALAVLTGAAQAQIIGGDVVVDGSRDDVIFLGGEMQVSGTVEGDVFGMAGDARIDANVTGDVQFFGGDLTLAGTVAGEVDAAAGDISISADVGNDVNAAAGDVTVTGNVSGDLNAAGGSVDVHGSVSGETHLAGGHVLLAPDSQYAGSVEIIGGLIEFEGVARDRVEIEAEEVVLAGRFEGDVEILAEQVRIAPSAVVTGTLQIEGPTEPLVEAGSSVAVLDYTQRDFDFEKENLDEFDVDFDFDGPLNFAIGVGENIPAAFLATAFVIGLLIALMSPKGLRGMTSAFRRRPVSALFLGAIGIPMVFLIILVVIVLLMATVIGIPLAILLLVMLPFIYIGFMAIGGFAIGDLIFNRNYPNAGLGLALRAASLLVVLVAVYVLGFAPGLGVLIGTIVLAIGIGSWLLSFGRHPDGRDDRQDEPAEAPRKDPAPADDGAVTESEG
ncbi:polymer-forming cytoskeletal protein [Maricaulis sp.]|uniref:polymer-forming cytoskeletal protein n=1 Tax=Maricaulis sp. TaxID=1486257 RepID=UPI002623E971|nr:polymer-forming cytoskeletal protein [Maricaulis sp.]